MILDFLKKYFLVLILVFLVGCKSDDDTPIIIEDTINGFWLAEDKGYVIEFTDDQDILYNVNTSGCSIADDNFKIEELAGLQLEMLNNNELIGRSELIASDIKFIRLENQNEFCLPDQISETDDPKVNYDHFWNIFNDYYAFFETRNVDWSQYEDLGEQVTSENFYQVIGELVLLLNDGHVAIDDEENNISIDSGVHGLLERLNASLSGDLVIDSDEVYDKLYNQRLEVIALKYLGGEYELDESGNIAWGIIDNVGYVNILGMEGYSDDESIELQILNSILDEMMDDFKNSGVSKLIIDVRFNGGGYDMVSIEIASRFVDQERLVFSKKARLGDSFTETTSVSVSPKGDFQFTDEIILLTSPLTASAAEIFTLCMKDLPYVTIVGDNTNGVFSDILVHVLPNGAFVGLSNEVYSDAQGVVYESIGVGPLEENRVPLFSNDDFVEEKDSGINKAVEILSNLN
ncbi:Peptidase family S41 [Aquimarina amphilecti]|uniref:Peptidase family S41 n=1 Tax=Aquimarina amphilecti TaxID=1038014 RepID=A0A1H7KPV7_AQUAM|nr:S41 family peptidase [Aquimarina amphilecti]SEK88560.1 Peptidase family S41 [Aquimarina amphilecti]